MDGQARDRQRVSSRATGESTRERFRSRWTRNGKLRAPVFLGLREDKEPGEGVRGA
jgi:hypothetical protein